MPPMLEKDVLEALGAIKDEFKTASAKLSEAVTKQNEDIAKFGGTMSETREEIKKHEEEMKALGANYAELRNDLQEGLKKIGRHLEPGSADGNSNQFKTLGQILTESNEFKRFMSSSSGSGESGDAMQSGRIKLKSLWQDGPRNMIRKAITGAGDLRQVFALERILQIMAQPLEAKRVRDLLTVIPTTNASVEWIRETGFTNRAAPQVEGQLKAESDLVFELQASSIRTVAHSTPLPRQVAEDVPALMAYIDTRLQAGLKIKEDTQLLSGDGTGVNLQGMLTDPNVQTYSELADGRVGDTAIDSIRRAATKVRLAQYVATGVILNPIDWEQIELAKDDQERYIWINVNTGGEARLWRLNVVDTTSMAEGDFLVGAFDLATILWDREEANMRVADQHDTDFLKNVIRVLVEERLALTTTRPEALVSGVFDGAPLS